MQSDFYLSWTGRYTAIAIQTLISQADLPTVYPWVCSMTLLGTFVAFRAIMGAIWPPETPRLNLVAAATVGIAVLNGRLPSSTEAFYWMTSAISYQWGLIAYVVWLSLLIRLSHDAQPRVAHRVVITVLTILLPGFNEVMLPIVLGTVGVFVLLQWQHTHTADRFMVAQLLAAIALTIVSLAAPGNAIRSSTYPDIPTRHDVVFAVVETARHTVRFLGNFGSYPALWAAALAAWWWGPRWTRLGSLRGPQLGAIAVVVPIALVFVTLLPLYWEYGAVNYTGEGRTYNVTYLAFCTSVIVGTTLVLSRATERWSGLILQKRAAADLVVASVLAVSIIGSSGTLRAYRALSTAPEYLRAQQAREAILRAPNNRGKMLVVDAMHIRPEGLFWGGIQSDEDHWINSCIAEYYGLASVRTPRPTPSN